jgi:protein-disulfide isomerase
MSELIPPVSRRDHVQGSLDAPLILVEYGDYECPHCKAAAPNVKIVQAELGDQLAFVFRHFPLIEIHRFAELAAEAAEAAGAQGRFWEMHDELFKHSPALAPNQLLVYARHIGLDVERFREELRRHLHLPRIQEDLDSGARSGVTGTPTFFMNGIRYRGPYDALSLIEGMKLVAAGAAG